MRRFICPHCSSPVFFADLACVTCRTELELRLDDDAIGRLESPCLARAALLCNWAAESDGWCVACALDLEPGHGAGEVDHQVFQAAKRRVVRQLHRLGIDPARTDPSLRFEMDRSSTDHRVTIGHADGLVTLDVAEAHPVVREETRTAMGEPYRTPLGHVRHESGHWHWAATIAPDAATLATFRELFGDERADYADALARHYDRPDDGSWKPHSISHYASAHPWEDYAESFAHVLHLLDTSETASARGLAPEPPKEFVPLYRDWVALTVSLNELSRSIGTPDPYPFAPRVEAVEKLRFVYEVLLAPVS